MIWRRGIVRPPMNELLLHNKNTILYGAGGGIGSGVALEFARQGGGCSWPGARSPRFSGSPLR
jgi:hypothetical protein